MCPRQSLDKELNPKTGQTLKLPNCWPPKGGTIKRTRRPKLAYFNLIVLLCSFSLNPLLDPPHRIPIICIICLELPLGPQLNLIPSSDKVGSTAKQFTQNFTKYQLKWVCIMPLLLPFLFFITIIVSPSPLYTYSNCYPRRRRDSGGQKVSQSQ